MNTKTIIRIGCLLYEFSIVAVGIHQIIIKDFRPEILPPFPGWAHTHIIFPVLTDMVLVIAGILIAGFSALAASFEKSISSSYKFQSKNY